MIDEPDCDLLGGRRVGIDQGDRDLAAGQHRLEREHIGVGGGQRRELRVRLGQRRGKHVARVRGLRGARVGEHGLVGLCARVGLVVRRVKRPPVDCLRAGRQPLKGVARGEQRPGGGARHVRRQVADAGLADDHLRGRDILVQLGADLGHLGRDLSHRLDDRLVRRVGADTRDAAEPERVPVRVDEADVLRVGAEDRVIPGAVVADGGTANRPVERIGDAEPCVRVRLLHRGHVRTRVGGVRGRHGLHAGGLAEVGARHGTGGAVVRLVALVILRGLGKPVVVFPAPVALVADLPECDALAGGLRLSHPGGGHVRRARAVVDGHEALGAERTRVGGKRGEVKRVVGGTGGGELRNGRLRGAALNVGVGLPVIQVGGDSAAVVQLADAGRLEGLLNAALGRGIGQDGVPRRDVDAERCRGERHRRTGGRRGARRARLSGQRRSGQDCQRRACACAQSPSRQSSNSHGQPSISWRRKPVQPRAVKSATHEQRATTWLGVSCEPPAVTVSRAIPARPPRGARGLGRGGLLYAVLEPDDGHDGGHRRAG